MRMNFITLRSLLHQDPFPFVKQLESRDCGPACLKMISQHHGKSHSLEFLREQCCQHRDGVSFLTMSEGAESIGLRARALTLSLAALTKTPLPCILHWRKRHFVVLYRIHKGRFCVADPAYGKLQYDEQEFQAQWIARKNGPATGYALLLEPSPDFYFRDEERNPGSRLKYFFVYLKPYKKLFIQILLGMLAASVLQLIFPFLTQSIIDIGISNHDMNFIYLILIAQLMLFLGRLSIDVIRSWLLLHISGRISVSLLSDFLRKMMRLPISYFETRLTGDLLQRITDHRRIESFLTVSTLSVLFSTLNILIFGVVLWSYCGVIFLVFSACSLLYFLWIFLFMKKRKELDYKRFTRLAENQSNLIELITGMQEIKLFNCEQEKRNDWEQLQAKLFKLNLKGLSLNQAQSIGAVFINELKNIIISFLAARSVIQGDMTLGMMLAIQYIVGQLNGPIEQLIGFIQITQDAKISLERLSEIHITSSRNHNQVLSYRNLPPVRDLRLQNLSFRYGGRHSAYVLKDLHAVIPEGFLTALVGVSGSGKTTLIKLLLDIYTPTFGEVMVGDLSLKLVHPKQWRTLCGAVMQDGFIFSGTVLQNIVMTGKRLDDSRLEKAIRIAHVDEFLVNFPMGLATVIGVNGAGLSQGQKQRILIARVIYKNPAILFLDEATNALDAQNETGIMDGLLRHFYGKTVVVAAHRLSTVRNADNILVLDKGGISEAGTHQQLVDRRGSYYNLVKEQLALSFN
jgi:ATP-binding cassette, subfamily B, bacterial